MTPEQFNAWRVMPRLLICSYYVFFAWQFVVITSWFMAYDFDTVSDGAVALAVAGFPAAILGVLSAVLSNLTSNYMNGPK